MRNKVILVYKDLEGAIAEETIWVQSDGENYKIDNIPFYAPNLALNDIISVEDEHGTLYFDDLIRPSGHSTLQVIFFVPEEIEQVLKVLERMGCKWEGMKDQPYFAIDVPPDTHYEKVKEFLDQKFKNEILDFKESCLSERHSN
jgi:hypothetical protein